LLSDGDKPVREIAEALPISRPAVSRHLRLLKEAGLVAEQAQGTRRIYHLQDQGMHAVQAYLERVWGDAARRFRLLAENTGHTGHTGNAEHTGNAGSAGNPGSAGHTEVNEPE
jgi:DNA-binding transcriptional ArsR family regulator